MRFYQYIHMFYRILRERGVWFLFVYFSESIWFDLKNRTHTFMRVSKNRQFAASNNPEFDDGLLYVASLTSVTRATVDFIFKTLGGADFSNYQFIDLGCGKAKAILVYHKYYSKLSLYPAIGIEYDSDLVEIATKNLSVLRIPPEKGQVVCDTAVNCPDYIKSNCAIIYLYNSFQNQTLVDTLASISNVKHFLIYIDPVELDIIISFGYKILRRNHGRYNANTWIIACKNI